MTRRGLIGLLLAPLWRDAATKREVTITRVSLREVVVWYFDADGTLRITRCASCEAALDAARNILTSDMA